MPVSSMVDAKPKYGVAYQEARLTLPIKLQQQMKDQLSNLNIYAVMAELKGYHEFKEDTHKTIVGVLCMLGETL